MPTTTPFNNLITFSRGSNATVTGPNGLIQWAPNNVLTFSEQFDNAAWLKLTGGTGVAPVVTANAGVAPDGTTTADRIVFNRGAGTTSSDTSRIFQDAPDPSNGVGTVSFYVRSTDGTSSYTMLIEAGFGNQQITVTGSWQRFSVTSTSSSLNAILGTAGNISAQSVDVLVWGGQTEIGSTATTYNPTTVKNLLGFSEAFDNAAWTKSNASIVTGAQANPVNGLFNAQKLMEDTVNAGHFINQLVTTIAGTSYTASVYLKAAGRNARLFVYQSASPFTTIGSITVDLSNGAVLSGSGTVVNVGSGWYRVSVTGAAIDTATRVRVDLAQGATFTYTGDGNSGVYIYGAQLSDSASLDPYVPTPGAAPSSTAFYGPRFDFDPVTLQPRGLLVEEQRTNLLLNSVFGGAVSGTPGTAPTSWGSFANGSIVVTSLGRNFAANSIRITTTSARHFYSQTVALAATGTWIITFKVNVGAAVRIDELLAFNTRPAGSTIQYFYNDAAQAASFVPPTGNGVLQVTVTTTGTSGNAEIRFGCGASNAVTADVTFWDAQWELGAFATSYIPTVASTVTRSADVATITGQNFAQWYRQDEGAFVADFDALTSASLGSANVLSAYASGTNLNRIWMWTGAPGVVRNSVVSGGAGVSELTGATLVANTPLKAASSYRVDSYAFTTNGGAVGSDTAGALPVGISVLGVGNIGGPSEYLNGHIRSIRFIPARAADFQLQALST